MRTHAAAFKTLWPSLTNFTKMIWGEPGALKKQRGDAVCEREDDSFGLMLQALSFGQCKRRFWHAGGPGRRTQDREARQALQNQSWEAEMGVGCNDSAPERFWQSHSGAHEQGFSSLRNLKPTHVTNRSQSHTAKSQDASTMEQLAEGITAKTKCQESSHFIFPIPAHLSVVEEVRAESVTDWKHVAQVS